MREDFAIIIPSYNRCDSINNNILKVLKEYNYSGRWYVVVDDSDPQLNEYKEKISDNHLYVFHKPDYYDYYDTCYNKKGVDAKLYPLAFIDDLVNDLDLNYYYIIDDDLNEFRVHMKRVDFNLDDVVGILINLMDNAKGIDCLGFILSGAFSSTNEFYNKNIVKYQLNGNYFFRYKNRIKFMFHFNDERCTLIKNIEIGNLIFLIRLIDLQFGLHMGVDFFYSPNQKETNTGGCSNQYTYVTDDFLNYKYIEILGMLMVRPNYFSRILVSDKIKFNAHHKAPKIIDERWKK